jgi:hypothetical protein
LSKQTELRDRFLSTVTHINSVSSKVTSNTVARGHRIFVSPDKYKLYEGLFLSAWTYWEQFIRQLMIADLADLPRSVLTREVRAFRTRNANDRLAQLILDHPDSDRWVEWSSVNIIIKRANEYLPAGHRYAALQPVQTDFHKMKRIRNAVAHKSDKAWVDFKGMITSPPFSLTPTQTRGVTVGRFLSDHNWNGSSVLEQSLTITETTVRNLIP